jgi:ribosomal protein S18 acetylase RimI-like enzyme
VDIRPIKAADLDELIAFFGRIPEGDRTFFKEDVSDRRLVEGWVSHERDRRLLAVDGSRVVGYLALLPGVGWSSHVGELRLVVEPEYRGRHTGSSLAYRGLQDALAMGLSKVVVEVVADQVPTIALFQGLGFEAEAVLTDHVRDATGRLHDLILLSHKVDDTWSAMTTIGLDQLLGGPA